MATRSSEKQSATEWIEQNRWRLSDFDLQIWHYAEPAWREYKSARAYCDLLRTEGFTVEDGSGGMPTAFAATWGNGRPVSTQNRRKCCRASKRRRASSSARV